MLNYTQPINNIANLPTLPVPDQKETMKKFLNWVKPLLSHEEYLRAKEEVENFLTQPIARKLHKKLVEKTKNNNSNWLIEWWINNGYLSSRGPIAPENNAFFSIKAPSIKDKPVSQRVAAAFYSTAIIYYDFITNHPPTYQIGKRYYSLDQLHGLFSSLRIPRKCTDEYYINNSLSTHGILLFRNRLFYIPLIENGEILSYNQIHNNIENILNEAVSFQEINANLISFACNRDEAATLQTELMSQEVNKLSHQQIQDAILMICYDDISTPTAPEQMRNAYINHQHFNRWHGKGIQLIFTNDAPITLISDHTFVDGGTQAYYINQLNQTMEKLSFELRSSIKQSTTEIKFKLSPPQKKALQQMKEDYLNYLDQLSIYLLELNDLTREKLRRLNILSADGFFHLALQLAQVKTFQAVYNTYIAVDMRSFFRGRTECLRPITVESLKFINSFSEGDLSTETYQLMLTALDEHYKRAKACQAGLGVNRYLYGLQQAYNELSTQKEKENPLTLFDTVAFETIQSNRLSTSSVPLPFIDKLGFQPVDPNGFGIGYAVGENGYALATCFSKYNHTLEILLEHLKQSIEELMSFAETMAKSSSC